MEFLCPLKSRDGHMETWMFVCVYSVFVFSSVWMEVLRRADPPSKESYGPCMRSRKGRGKKKAANAHQWAVEPFTWKGKTTEAVVENLNVFWQHSPGDTDEITQVSEQMASEQRFGREAPELGFSVLKFTFIKFNTTVTWSSQLSFFLMWKTHPELGYVIFSDCSRYEQSSPAPTPTSWVRIPLQGMDVCVRLFCACVILCVSSGLETDWCPIQGALPKMHRIRKTEKEAKAQQKGCRA
jgi:hypothetical protein